MSEFSRRMFRDHCRFSDGVLGMAGAGEVMVVFAERWRACEVQLKAFFAEN